MMFDSEIELESTASGFRRIVGKNGQALLDECREIVERYSREVERVFRRVREMSLTDLRVAARNAYLANPE